jgi:hypothetical protein
MMGILSGEGENYEELQQPVEEDQESEQMATKNKSIVARRTESTPAVISVTLPEPVLSNTTLSSVPPNNPRLEKSCLVGRPESPSTTGRQKSFAQRDKQRMC